MKTAVMILGFVAVGIALADLATGNSNKPLLPAVIGDHLEQQDDLWIGGLGAGALYLAFTQL